MLLINTDGRSGQDEALHLPRLESLRAHLTSKEGLTCTRWSGAYDDRGVGRQELQVPALIDGPCADHLGTKHVLTLSAVSFC